MYHQIARNRRKSVLVIVLFFLFWVGAGYGIGQLAGSASGAITGATIAGILALLAVLYALTFGRATILAVSGAKPVTQAEYPQLYDIVSTLAIGDGLPMRRHARQVITAQALQRSNQTGS